MSVTEHPARTHLHIAFVISFLASSGAERSLLKTADGWIGLGHRADIALLRPGIRHSLFGAVQH